MKTMLITGTTQGIGKGLYEHYKDCYKVITLNRREFYNNNIICDLSDYEVTQRIAERISNEHIDILINNAGGAEPVSFKNLTAEKLMKCTNLNYHAPVLLMQAVLEGMKNRHYGRIINISSIAAKSPRALLSHYGAAKSSLEAISSSLAVAYGNCGVTINCVCPGGVKTETSLKNRISLAKIDGHDDNYFNNMISEKNGLGRMVLVEEVVGLIDFLISDNAEAISGQSYNICGTSEVH